MFSEIGTVMLVFVVCAAEAGKHIQRFGLVAPVLQLRAEDDVRAAAAGRAPGAATPAAAAAKAAAAPAADPRPPCGTVGDRFCVNRRLMLSDDVCAGVET